MTLAEREVQIRPKFSSDIWRIVTSLPIVPDVYLLTHAASVGFGPGFFFAGIDEAVNPLIREISLSQTDDTKQ